jgi:uncharacterized protein with PQ loop repeat
LVRKKKKQQTNSLFYFFICSFSLSFFLIFLFLSSFLTGLISKTHEQSFPLVVILCNIVLAVFEFAEAISKKTKVIEVDEKELIHLSEFEVESDDKDD